MQIHGTFDARYQSVADELARQVRQFGGGAAVCVYREGQSVVDIWTGHKDQRGTAWESDTVAMSFSTTKGVLMTALHICAARGLIDYEEPVATYWPEFAQGGKAAITVRQLLSHQAGLFRFPAGLHFSAALDWHPVAEALAQQTPAHRPGQRSGYHAMTIAWLVGELVSRVSGKSIDRFIADEIAAPLGIDGLFVGVPEDQLHRIARLSGPRRDLQKASAKSTPSLGSRARKYAFNLLAPHVATYAPRLGDIWGAFYAPGVGAMMHKDAYHQVPIPSANGHFTARGLARMYAMLANDGELDGAQLLNKQILDAATEIQSRGRDHILGFPMRWSLGYHRFGRGSTFGHMGMGGSGGWANRKQNLSAAMVHNGNPMGLREQLRMLGISRAVKQSLASA